MITKKLSPREREIFDSLGPTENDIREQLAVQGLAGFTIAVGFFVGLVHSGHRSSDSSLPADVSGKNSLVAPSMEKPKQTEPENK
jgi:hypothetical protein